MSFTLRRSRACSPASCTAAAWTASKARATSPISSWVSTPIGLTRTSGIRPSTAVIPAIVAGSRERAIWNAEPRSVRSGTSSDRATTTTTATVSSTSSATSTPSRTAPARALAASAAPSVASCCCPATSTSRISAAVRPAARSHSPAWAVGSGSPRVIAVSTRCSMRCRASTSAPATVAAHRSRNDGDAAVPRSASAADRAASSSAVVGPPISTAATVACWRRTCSFAAATVTASFAARSSGAGAAVNAAPSKARNTSMTAVYAEPTRSVGNAEPVTARRSAARSASRSRAAASRSAAAGPNWVDGRARTAAAAASTCWTWASSWSRPAPRPPAT